MMYVKIRPINLLLLAILAVNANGSSLRRARQASQCRAGTSCIPLDSCPSLKNLLKKPTTENLIRVRDALCNRSRRNPLVCCGPTTPTETPVSSVTPPGSSSETPTGPTNPGGGGEGLLPSVCGRAGTSRKIFNGVEAPVGAFPWMAVLGYTKPSPPGGLDWGCGGVLINDQYVLTAAHCVVFTPLPLNEIRLGEHNLDTDPDCTGAECPSHQAFKIKGSQIIIHPNYNTRTNISDDIALIRLDRKVTFNRLVQPACLPDAQFDVESFLNGRKATVAGWGTTETRFKSRVLKSVGVPFVNLDTCKPLYEIPLNSDQLCFGGEGGRDSCRGDSGGPIFQASTSGTRTTVLGLVSLGNECGTDPAIYTKVSSYRSWIVQNLRP
ncbi:CLIP domain-containing serine protease HP8-like [Palaemon carinicauda]|uniref:CLIP domain-containing serine protease HP8-like n=1 Tax=Palaemon carinicauda TaxID=392227 RepID=UPI0035B696AB